MTRPDNDGDPDRRVLLQCLSYYLPNLSGLTLCAVEIGRALRARGHEVQVLTSRSPGQPAQETIDGISVTRAWTPFRLGKAPLMPLLAVQAWRAMRDTDVVAIHLPNADAGLLALVARLRGARVMLQYHCSLSRAGTAAQVMRALAGVSHLVAGALATRIQVVSPDYAAGSVFCRLYRRKLLFAPPAVGITMLRPVTPRPQRPADAPLRIGCVGRLATQKNLPLLLEAFEGLDETIGQPVHLCFAGPTEDVIGENSARAPLARIRQDPRMDHLSALDIDALRHFYADLDLLVLPSTDRQESFGLVQIEAMAQGTPVVAFDRPGIRLPIAQTGMGQLCPRPTATALRNTIAQILREGPPVRVSIEDLSRLYGAQITCKAYIEQLEQ